ncbi:MAG: Stp1/IreP family PP2C-type Ser/Thr phosphatase [Gammaproteobacteria bacterium]|jgi:serine/threonine protein phosphatase PrpC
MNLANKLDIVNLSDVGRRRPHNEDSTLTDARLGLMVLADGMGGYKAGEVASAIAVTSIHEGVRGRLKALRHGGQPVGANGQTPQLQAVKEAIIYSNSEIYRKAQRDPQCHGMGTTIIAALFHDNSVTIAHVGDSRAYRLRRNEFRQITKDHSLIQELIDRGLYTPEEAALTTPRNLVTRALGIEPEVKVDIMEEQASPGDIYLLCSDGLNDMVDDEEIHLTLSKYSANLVQAAEELVRLANAKGGRDNTSVILIRIREEFPASGRIWNKLINHFFD